MQTFFIMAAATSLTYCSLGMEQKSRCAFAIHSANHGISILIPKSGLASLPVSLVTKQEEATLNVLVISCQFFFSRSSWSGCL